MSEALLKIGAPARFKPYPAYKDSGVEWLGQVPARWEIAPLFTIARERDVRNIGGREANVLSLSYGRIVRRDVSDNFGLLPESFDTYQIVEPGNIVLRLTDLQNDKRSLRVGLVREQGIITSAYVALNVDARLQHDYAAYLLHAYDVTKVFYALGAGVRQTMKFEDLKRIPMLVPGEREQRDIVTFLSRETSKIDALLTKRERMIELLQEKRVALITQAVTKGLDPTVPMKDSGIEWLGRIPAHWEVKRIRHIVDCIEQGWSPDCENREADDDEWGVLKAGCVNRGIFIESEHKALPATLEPAPELEIKKGDLLMSRASGSRDLVGSVALVAKCRRRLLLCDKLFRLHVSTGQVEKAFLAYAMNSRSMRSQIEVVLSGGSGLANNIAQDVVKDLTLAQPGRNEQASIVNFLVGETAKIDALIAKIREGVDCLTEYRTALISAAVTGKIDVREAA